MNTKSLPPTNQMIFLNMRRFHNWIKRKLLEEYTPKNASLLDLACGKGGDIHKWMSVGVKKVRGYDIDTDSIQEAKKRYSQKVSELDFDYVFTTQDLSVKSVITEETFDISSCFFAIHYFVETIQTFIKSLDSLKRGGYFLVTTLCSKELKRIDYSLKSKDLSIVKKDVNTISVFIKDSVLDKPTDEYIVDYDNFLSVMERNGFQLVTTKLFSDFYQEWVSETNSWLNLDSQDYSFLNRVYIFVKT